MISNIVSNTKKVLFINIIVCSICSCKGILAYQFTQKQCARGSLMRITRHTKIETPKRKMKQNFVLQYILYACTNVTKRVNREINARGDERRKMIRIGENTAHTTLDVKSTTTTGPTSLFFFIETTIKAKPSHRRSNEYSL